MEQVKDKKNLVRKVSQNFPNIIQVAWKPSSKNTPSAVGHYQESTSQDAWMLWGKNNTPWGTIRNKISI